MAFDAATAPNSSEGRTADPVDVHVGRRIRARRKELKLTQEKLADQLKLTFQQVQKYERGANRVSASKLFRTAQILRVPINYFFEGLTLEGEATTTARLADQMLADGSGFRLATAFVSLAAKPRQQLANIAEQIAEASGLKCEGA